MDESTLKPVPDILLLPQDGLPGLHELRLKANLFTGQIDLRAFRAKHPHYPVLCSSPLVLEPEKGRYCYLSRFGVAVCWNCPEALIQALHEDLLGMPGVGQLAESATDRLKVSVGGAEDRVDYNEVWLGQLTLDKLRLVSLLLAQSVALDQFDIDVSAALARFQPVVHAMRELGQLSLQYAEVLKIVGFTMDVRINVLGSLALFDDPPETWENEALDRLHHSLYHQFDLQRRLEAINQKLAYLTDAAATVMGVLTSRTSHRMEWIIIVLIFIETAFFVWKEVLFR
jgi:uncharacterized Rmd1/YagE family protein